MGAVSPDRQFKVIFVVVQSLSHVDSFATPQTVALQAPLSMGFPSQEYWIWLPFPSPGNPPDPGVEPGSPALHAGSLLTELHAITFWMHFFPTHYSDGLDL